MGFPFEYVFYTVAYVTGDLIKLWMNRKDSGVFGGISKCREKEISHSIMVENNHVRSPV